MTIEELFITAIVFSFLIMFQAIIVVFLVWLLKKKQVWSLIKFALRGGSLVLKGHPDNAIEILHSKRPVEFVTWKARDPTTNKNIDLKQVIIKVYHTLKGTSYPIHFCPCTFPTNIDILSKEKAQLSTREINALQAKEYLQGQTDAMGFQKIGGFPIEKATLMMLVIVALVNIVTLVFAWQTLAAVKPA